MLVRIKTIDGQKSVSISVSKTTPISELREKLQNLFEVKVENQRLFYKGKQLENCYTIFDYDIRNNDVVQLMIKSDFNAVQSGSSSSNGESISEAKAKKDTVCAISNYFKVGDYVDVRDTTYGAWFEARIMEIYSKLIDSDAVSSGKQANETTNDQIREKSEMKEGTEELASANISADQQAEQALNNETEGAIAEQEMKRSAANQQMKIVTSSNKGKTTLMNHEEREIKESSASDALIYKTMIDDEGNHTFIEASLHDIRPRARNTIKLSDLKKDDVVLVNYNIEEPKELGHWYDFRVTESKVKRGRTELRGTILVGRNETPLYKCRICNLDEIFQIEKPYLLKNRSIDDERIMESPSHIKRQNLNQCTTCYDDPNRKCKECSCCVCGGKNNPEKQILCDECDAAYHLACLKPPLDQVPDVDEWYCPSCKNDANEIVKAGEKLKESKKKAKMVSKKSETKRDWGSGMACIGRTKECTLVPPNHYGPIPGVEVGQAWLYRVQVSEAGIHRPHVAGIHGRETDGAYSLVLSGGYEGDEDNGDEFLYTGSGGRDLSGNKRTASQSSDQKLTRMNKALASNCAAKLNEKGAEAKDWKKGKPVRVVRNYKLSKHSKYAPEVGNRYDGIYKVVKYFPEKGESGFVIWRYVLRRDDSDPAPWTPEGKKRIESLGLQIPEAPEGYEMEGQEENRENAVTKSKKRKHSTQDGPTATPNQKKQKVEAYSLSDFEVKLIKRDKLNKKRWDECCQALQEGKIKFLSTVQEAFQCVICLDLVRNPVTTPCEHNICDSCLKRARSADVVTCPCCRAELGSDFVANVNDNLKDLLCKMFAGYSDQ